MKNRHRSFCIYLLAGLVLFPLACTRPFRPIPSPFQPTPTHTVVMSPSFTPTSTATDTGTFTATATRTSTPTASGTATPSNTPTTISTPGNGFTSIVVPMGGCASVLAPVTVLSYPPPPDVQIPAGPCTVYLIRDAAEWAAYYGNVASPPTPPVDLATHMIVVTMTWQCSNKVQYLSVNSSLSQVDVAIQKIQGPFCYSGMYCGGPWFGAAIPIAITIPDPGLPVSFQVSGP